MSLSGSNITGYECLHLPRTPEGFSVSLAYSTLGGDPVLPLHFLHGKNKRKKGSRTATPGPDWQQRGVEVKSWYD